VRQQAGGENVDPKNAEEYHLDNHPRWVVFDGGGVICASGPFFDGENAAFDVGDVFVFAAYVELRPKVSSDGAVSAFKFAVTKNIGDAEAAFPIYAVDALEGFNEGTERAVIEDFSGDKTDVLRDGEKKRNLIDKHDDVNAESDVAVMLHDILGDIVGHSTKDCL
jgi:hypothetical protein